MEKWRRVWREGLAPVISSAGLEALWQALRKDDPRLQQGAVCSPPALPSNSRATVVGCCSIGICGWQGEKLSTVGEIDDFFHQTCFEADHRLGEPGGCRWFLNWFDETPRQEMRLELLAEVELACEQRFLLDRLSRAVPARRNRGERVPVSAA